MRPQRYYTIRYREWFVNFSHVWIEDRHGNQTLCLCWLRPCRKGRHTLIVEVTKGAPGLKGVKQRFHSEYALCGVEAMQDAIPGVVALVTFLPAVIIVTVIAKVTLKRRRASEDEA